MARAPFMRSVATLVLAGCLAAGGLALAQAPTPSAGDADAGAAIAGRYRAGCHGAQGRGGAAPSISSRRLRHGSTDAEIRTSILDGHLALGMPAFRGVLSDDQVGDLLAFMRRLAQVPDLGVQDPARLVPPDPLPTGVVRTESESYRLDRVAKLSGAFAFDVLPDDRILVSQFDGRLRVIEDGNLLPRPIEGTPIGPPPEDIYRRQLLDVAVHPDYAANGWIYLSWAMQEPGASGLDPVRLVLSRGRIRDGRWSDGQDLLQVRSLSSTSGRIALDGRGHVFFSVMDNFGNSDENPPAAQDLSTATGKILRLREDGSVPPDNPFVGRAGAFPYIWSLGLRATMGLAFDRQGRLWGVDMGPRGGDELNLIEKGGNYGWPMVTWGHRYDEKLVIGRPYQEGIEQPVVNWSPSPAVSGLTVYTGAAFPRWKDNLFVTTAKSRSLLRIVLDAHGRAVLEERVLDNVFRMRDVGAATDGTLYVLSEDGDLFRLSPVNGPRASAAD